MKSKTLSWIGSIALITYIFFESTKPVYAVDQPLTKGQVVLIALGVTALSYIFIYVLLKLVERKLNK